MKFSIVFVSILKFYFLSKNLEDITSPYITSEDCYLSF